MELPDAALKIGAAGKWQDFQKDFFYRLVISRKGGQMRDLPIYAYSFFVVFILTASLTGCAYHIPPKPQQVNSKNIQEFNSVKAFHIINNQPSKDELTIGTSLGRRFYSSLHEFSDAAVELLTSELTKRGMTSSIDATKVLKLSVLDAQLTERGFRWNCAVSMKMETDEGYTAEFKANNLTPSMERVCGGAITLAITKIMNDQKFINYLKE
jgi:hypothetical protein